MVITWLMCLVRKRAASDKRLRQHLGGLRSEVFQQPAREFTRCTDVGLGGAFQTCADYYASYGYHHDFWYSGWLSARCEFMVNGSDIIPQEPYETACPGTMLNVFRSVKEKPKLCEKGALPDQFGNPVRPLTGTKSEVITTDFSVGNVPLVLTYDSAKAIVIRSDLGLLDSGFGDIPAFGAMWMGNFHKNLLINAPATDYKIYRGNGTVVTFWPTADGFTSDSDVNDKLVAVAGGYLYTNALSKTQERYDSTGQLITSADALGNRLTYVYSTTASATSPAAGYLMSVTDNNGRSIAFEYTLTANLDANKYGRISKITDSSGRSIVSAYDSNENLTSLTWSDTKTRKFVYENPSAPWALTGVIDELDNRFSTFGYDTNGLAISSEHAGGVNKFTVSYQTPPAAVVRKVVDVPNQTIIRYHEWQAPTGGAVTDPTGASISLSSTDVLGRPKMKGLSQAAGSGCQAANSDASHDTNGNVLSSNDFNGNRTCFAYDAKNREILRVEGLASTADCTTVTPANATLPVGARKIATQWHPDWQQRTKVTAPGSITSTVYQGQPDPFNGNAPAHCTSTPVMPDGKPLPLVCKSVVQATLANGGIDNSVQPHSSTFAYDNAGRILSVKDALNHTTSYTYYSDTSFTGVDPNAVGHTMGDLQSTTDTTGLVTTFNAYDKLGRVLQMTDPKGIVTDKTYTPRGWLHTVSVTPPGGASRTTTNTYDNAGQLIGVSNPDGTNISYTYDAAHRLVGASDARGNSVSYTLDNAGNRIAEQLKDPSGVLQRTMSRSFDALNRVQQLQLQ